MVGCQETCHDLVPETKIESFLNISNLWFQLFLGDNKTLFSTFKNVFLKKKMISSASGKWYQITSQTGE